MSDVTYYVDGLVWFQGVGQDTLITSTLYTQFTFVCVLWILVFFADKTVFMRGRKQWPDKYRYSNRSSEKTPLLLSEEKQNGAVPMAHVDYSNKDVSYLTYLLIFCLAPRKIGCKDIIM